MQGGRQMRLVTTTSVVLVAVLTLCRALPRSAPSRSRSFGHFYTARAIACLTPAPATK